MKCSYVVPVALAVLVAAVVTPSVWRKYKVVEEEGLANSVTKFIDMISPEYVAALALAVPVAAVVTPSVWRKYKVVEEEGLANSVTKFINMISPEYVAALALAVLVAAVVTPSVWRKYKVEEEEGLANSATKFIDTISPEYVVALPPFDAPRGIQPFFHPILTFHPRTGTPVDGLTPSDQSLWDKGYGVHFVDLHTLDGPCIVVDTPRDKNITAEVIKELNIWRGVKRFLFRTLNTDRKLMYQKEFDSSYTAFTGDGAQYLVANTDIKLVGIDYMSVDVGVREEVVREEPSYCSA